MPRPSRSIGGSAFVEVGKRADYYRTGGSGANGALVMRRDLR